MSLVTKVVIRNNRIVQVGDIVTCDGHDWIGPVDQDYRGRKFKIIEDRYGYRYIDNENNTIDIRAIKLYPNDFV